MALTLHLTTERWRAHLAATWAATPGLVPVVKGNGYGVGRPRLWAEAVALGADEIAVGTLSELPPPAEGPRPVVLTPALAQEVTASGLVPGYPILTVGSLVHVAELAGAGYPGLVSVKLASPMARYGVGPEDLRPLLAAIERTGMVLHSFGLHLPLDVAGVDSAGVVAGWLARLPADAVVHVSHLAPAVLARLAADHPRALLRPRVGTALWHGDRACFALRADVLDVHPVQGGARVGYRGTTVPAAGHLVMASGGTAHGLHPLAPDARSPFHFRRTRLALVEPPHMQTSMLFVPEGAPRPEVGDELDVQHPLTWTWADRVVEH